MIPPTWNRSQSSHFWLIRVVLVAQNCPSTREQTKPLPTVPRPLFFTWTPTISVSSSWCCHRAHTCMAAESISCTTPRPQRSVCEPVMNAPLKMSPGKLEAVTVSEPGPGGLIATTVRGVGAQKPPRAPPLAWVPRFEQRFTPAWNWSLYWPNSPYRTVAPIGLQALRQKGLMYQASGTGLLTENDTLGLPAIKSGT